jgi:hypothetical protein
MRELLNAYFFVVIICLTSGVVFKSLRLLKVMMKNGVFYLPKSSALDPPPVKKTSMALREVLLGPIFNFHLKVNKTWTMGYLAYHIGVFIIVSGYIVAGLVLISKMLLGTCLIDIELGVPSAASLTPANMLGIIFGNGEMLQSVFLYGAFAKAVRILSWAGVSCAVLGNLCLLITHCRAQSGAVIGDLDPATRKIRTRGIFSLQHTLVGILVLGIIMMEIVGRLGVQHGIVYVHAALALTLILFLLGTYLSHLAYMPLTLYIAIQKRKHRVFA